MRNSTLSTPAHRGFLSRAVLAASVAVIGLGGLAGSADAVPRKVKRECRGDYKQFCPSYKIGTSRMRSCMRSNGRQLSWGCYQALKDAGYVRGSRNR